MSAKAQSPTLCVPQRMGHPRCSKLLGGEYNQWYHQRVISQREKHGKRLRHPREKEERLCERPSKRCVIHGRDEKWENRDTRPNTSKFVSQRKGATRRNKRRPTPRDNPCRRREEGPLD